MECGLTILYHLLSADLEEVLLWTLLNSGVALIGYWLAAAVVDNPKVGRLRLQLLGFAADAILFYIAAAVYPSLTSKKGLPTFQFIYFFSSFWGQFGPNCTTFLLAGVSPQLFPFLFPFPVRCTMSTPGCPFSRSATSTPHNLTDLHLVLLTCIMPNINSAVAVCMTLAK